MSTPRHPPTKRPLETPWGILGAVAGALGVVVAVIALLIQANILPVASGSNTPTTHLPSQSAPFPSVTPAPTATLVPSPSHDQYVATVDNICRRWNAKLPSSRASSFDQSAQD